MGILSILYWVILVLSVIGMFLPPAWGPSRYIGGGAALALFIIIGIKYFKIPLQ